MENFRETLLNTIITKVEKECLAAAEKGENKIPYYNEGNLKGFKKALKERGLKYGELFTRGNAWENPESLGWFIYW